MPHLKSAAPVEFQSNSRRCFIDHAIFPLSHAAMRAVQLPSTIVAWWKKKPVGSRGGAAVRSARVRRDEQHAKNTTLIIVLTLFSVFLAPALLIGGRALIEPILRAANERRQTNRIGEVVFTMPDGAFCRHLSFNNTTAEVIESTVDHCPEARPRGKDAVTSQKGFAWGAN
jgi:hypothetical protein